jgi:hypothetical protein
MRKLLTEPEGDEEIEIPIDYNVAIYTILIMLLEGDALTIVQRYSTKQDGVAAFMALERVVYRDVSPAFLSKFFKQIANFEVTGRGDPTEKLNELQDLHVKVSKLTEYSVEQQKANIVNVLGLLYFNITEQVTKKTTVDELIYSAGAYWLRFIEPQNVATS